MSLLQVMLISILTMPKCSDIIRTNWVYSVKQKEFYESEIDDYREPLHVEGMDPVWQNFNQNFYKKNNLIHYYDSDKGKYVINFKVTGFDRDPLTSLIIEAKKKKNINLESYKSLNNSPLNYNKYAWSLLKDKEFSKKNDKMLKAKACK